MPNAINSIGDVAHPVGAARPPQEGVEHSVGDSLSRPLDSSIIDLRKHYVLPGKVRTVTPLYVHQAIGVARAVRAGQERGYFALLDKCGLGKTIQAIYAAECLRQLGVVRKVIVICKPDLITGWHDEMKQHTPGWSTHVLQGREPDDRAWDAIATTHLINFELLGRKPPRSGKRATVRNAFSGRQLLLSHDAVRMAEYMRQNSCVLIVDESHKIKNLSARITATLCSLAGLARVRYILTATINAESPLDVWSQIHFLDGGRLLGRSYKAFERQYAITYDITVGGRGEFEGCTVTKVSGYKNLSRLRNQLATVSLGRRKEQCLDLPPKIPKVREVVATGQQYKLLCTIRDRIRMLLARESDAVSLRPGTTLASCIQDLIRAAAMPCVVDATVKQSAKLDSLKEILTETDEQVVVWCVHRNVVDAVVDALPDAERVHGGIVGAQRAQAVERFKRGVSRELVCTVGTMSMGHNLQMASHAVYFQLDWSRLQWVQSQDRIHRIGQTRSVVVERLLMPTSLDLYIDQTLQGKVKVAGTLEEGGVTSEVTVSKKHLLDNLKW